MTTLICPKCRQGMPEAALDAGSCPACGFPIDGPLVLDTGRRSTRLRALVLVGILLAAVGAACYVVSRRTNRPEPEPANEVVANDPEPVAPPQKPREPEKAAPKTAPPTKPPTIEPKPVPPAPVPKKDSPTRPLGVVLKVDPKIAPRRHLDHPDDTAALPDLHSADRVVLTGRVRTLRIGSVNGKGEIDASGLVAEEVVITGDLNGEAVVILNAPGGKVTLGGYVGGTVKLTVAAPGGEVLLPASSGRVTGSAAVVVTAKRLDLAGKVFGAARLDATFTAGGALRFAAVEEGAVVTFKRSAATDPPITIEKGEVRGGGKVIAQ